MEHRTNGSVSSLSLALSSPCVAGKLSAHISKQKDGIEAYYIQEQEQIFGFFKYTCSMSGVF
jgi:hypothetical protein